MENAILKTENKTIFDYIKNINNEIEKIKVEFKS
jgi:hypothetical protein